ncbi:hypothetical protein GLA29479_579 [Lysobacter antibioticus]|nr:hypothetical protein GLA29479_579 [Lysobacter antibioticus]
MLSRRVGAAQAATKEFAEATTLTSSIEAACRRESRSGVRLDFLRSQAATAL